MRFSDFKIGQVITSPSHHITEQEVLDFAKRWDPQWFHVDPKAAEQGFFAGLIASGTHTLAIATRLLVTSALQDANMLASPGFKDIRWPAPARPGDTVRLHAEVLNKRVLPNQTGMIQWHWLLQSQRDEVLLDAKTSSLLKLEAQGTQT